MNSVAPSVLRCAVNPVPTSYRQSSTSKIIVVIVMIVALLAGAKILADVEKVENNR